MSFRHDLTSSAKDFFFTRCSVGRARHFVRKGGSSSFTISPKVTSLW